MLASNKHKTLGAGICMKSEMTDKGFLRVSLGSGIGNFLKTLLRLNF